ncbi:hypothetical protein BB06_02805 [Pediococcus pentosaceus CGMCC 7049]|uniref:Uncharacterized protein n=1 Tax=Pediococcus pentosaceus CGMCC 7049 TaxID=1460385 RepID=A0AAU7NMS5_PEDPE|nr:hypothetical protein [Pediococcus pentosaceus]WPK17548.1 hypothetical protein R6U75_09810 [Pediococcus pentosaceus]
MEIEIANDLLHNINDNEYNSFKQLAVSFTQLLQKKYPIEYDIADIDPSFTNESIQVIFYNRKPSLLSEKIIVITNFRIFSISSVDLTATPNIKEVIGHDFMNDLIEVNSKSTYLEIKGSSSWYIFKSKNQDDQDFITHGEVVHDRIMSLNKSLVSVQNKINEKLKADPNNLDNNGRIHVGSMPDNFEYVDIIYTQAENFNFVSNNGNFTRAMDKIMNQLYPLIGPEQSIFNLRITSQNMGDTYSVNAVGDLCERKSKNEVKKPEMNEE